MIELPMRIRWRDVDSYGHVNNAVYLTYLEEARDRWVETTLPGTNFVIVRIAIDYRRELALADDEVIAKAGWVAAKSASVVVAHDEVGRRSRALTAEERARLDAAIEADG